MFIEQAHETKLAQVGNRYGLIHMTRTGVPPWAPTIIGRYSSTVGVESSPVKFPSTRTGPLPLSPQDTAQFPTHPLVEFLKAVPDIRHPVVGYPTP